MILKTFYANVIKSNMGEYKVIVICQKEDDAIKAAKISAIFNNNKYGYVAKFSLYTSGIAFDTSYGKRIIILNDDASNYKVEDVAFLGKEDKIQFEIFKD